MGYRKITLSNNKYYHIINRSIDFRPIFKKTYLLKRALLGLAYYQSPDNKVKLSEINNIKDIIELRSKKPFYVDMVSFCFMPNHFHLLLKQNIDNGISKFIGNFCNSFTRYFNTLSKRNGPLFQGRFKAIEIDSESYLLHLNRYIHLNPYSGKVVKTLPALCEYIGSSLVEYLGKKTPISLCSKGVILKRFNSIDSYKKFVLDQADYQKSLQKIKSLILEDDTPGVSAYNVKG